MKLFLYGLRDIKMNNYLNIFELQNDEIAIRGLKTSLFSPNCQFRGYASDIELFRFGSWDTVTGIINSYNPEFICNASDLLSKVEDKSRSEDIQEVE